MSVHDCPWCQCADGTTDTHVTTHRCPWCQCPSGNVECPVVDENGNHPVEHDGAECWHCGAKPENVEEPTSPLRNPLDLPVPEGDPPDEYRTPENVGEPT